MKRLDKWLHRLQRLAGALPAILFTAAAVAVVVLSIWWNVLHCTGEYTQYFIFGGL